MTTISPSRSPEATTTELRSYRATSSLRSATIWLDGSTTHTAGLEGLGGEDPSGLLGALAKNTLFDRLVQPAEVAAAVLFLLSDASSGVTGSELFVDNGEAHSK